MPKYKTVHVSVAALSALFMTFVLVARPALTANAPATVGSVGSFLTLYGLLFTIIELLRTRSAAEMAVEEGRQIHKYIFRGITSGQIAECKSYIKTALDFIDKNSRPPANVLISLLELYSEIFHLELQNANSEHRRNQAAIQANVYPPFDRGEPVQAGYDANGLQSTSSAQDTNTLPYQHTKEALVSVTIQLATLKAKGNSISELTNDSK